MSRLFEQAGTSPPPSSSSSFFCSLLYVQIVRRGKERKKGESESIATRTVVADADGRGLPERKNQQTTEQLNFLSRDSCGGGGKGQQFNLVRLFLSFAQHGESARLTATAAAVLGRESPVIVVVPKGFPPQPTRPAQFGGEQRGRKRRRKWAGGASQSPHVGRFRRGKDGPDGPVHDIRVPQHLRSFPRSVLFPFCGCKSFQKLFISWQTTTLATGPSRSCWTAKNLSWCLSITPMGKYRSVYRRPARSG